MASLGTFQLLPSRVGSWTCPQALEQYGNACQAQALLLGTLVNYGRKKLVQLENTGISGKENNKLIYRSARSYL
jgi:hypothetical protein